MKKDTVTLAVNEASRSEKEIEKNDTLYFDSIFINEDVPLKLPEEELTARLGNADSVVIEHC